MGQNGFGGLYEFSRESAYKLLYSFVATVGEFPEGSLTQHTNGMLYGTAFKVDVRA